MLNELLKTLDEQYHLKEVSNETTKVSHMNFIIHQYYAQGLGNVSTMEAKMPLGIMKMDTLIINPFEIDLPLFSYDRILAMGNDSLYEEIFETRIDTSSNPEYVKELCNLKGSYDFEVKPNWYEDILYKESIHKKTKKKNSQNLDEVTRKFFNVYLNWAKEAKACDVNLKKQKAKVYTEGLLSNGGPSTDVFVKAKGREYTEELYRTKLFGTE